MWRIRDAAATPPRRQFICMLILSSFFTSTFGMMPLLAAAGPTGGRGDVDFADLWRRARAKLGIPGATKVGASGPSDKENVI